MVHALVGHVHLKGLDHGEFCEFGVGDVDLHAGAAGARSLRYRGGFSVEYEGPHDGTLRLFQSVKRARAAVQSGSFGKARPAERAEQLRRLSGPFAPPVALLHGGGQAAPLSKPQLLGPL